jgi:integrase
MTFREEITKVIKEKRPKIGENSIKTYTSLLFNLAKKLDGNDMEFFHKNVETILNHLKDVASNLRKTTLSALYIITGDDEYRKIMLDDCNKTNQYYKEQTKNKKEEENWISFDEIKAKYNELLGQVKAMFGRNAVINDKVIMEYFVIALLSGASGLSPRRSLDYSEMKIRNYDPKVDNYYKNGVFYYNQYKTSKKYGLTTINVKQEAPELDAIIKKWIKINPKDYLLYSTNGEKLAPSQITRISNGLFDGKKISVDMYRHFFLTNYYKDKPIPDLETMEKLAHEMGHSVQTALQYIKK